MGGYGSGLYQQATAKPTDKECLKLPINQLHNAGAIVWNEDTRGRIKIADKVLSFQVQDNIFLVRMDNLTCAIHLCITEPSYGGLRVWFTCPGCAKRSGVLYLQPGTRYFRCFECSNLARSSSRKSKKPTQDSNFDARMERINKLLELDKAL